MDLRWTLVRKAFGGVVLWSFVELCGAFVELLSPRCCVIGRPVAASSVACCCVIGRPVAAPSPHQFHNETQQLHKTRRIPETKLRVEVVLGALVVGDGWGKQKSLFGYRRRMLSTFQWICMQDKPCLSQALVVDELPCLQDAPSHVDLGLLRLHELLIKASSSAPVCLRWSQHSCAQLSGNWNRQVFPNSRCTQ